MELQLISQFDEQRIKSYRFYQQIKENSHAQAFGVNLGAGADKLLYVAQIFPTIISDFYSDLLFNEPLTIKSEKYQKQIDEILNTYQNYDDQDDFQTSLWELSFYGSMMGDMVQKVYRNEKKEVFIEPITADYYFPAIDKTNCRRTLYRDIIMPLSYNNNNYIWIERHYKGYIENILYEVKTNIGSPQDILSYAQKVQVEPVDTKYLAEITGDTQRDFSEKVETGIDDYLVHFTPNKRSIDSYWGESDWFQIMPLMEELNNRVASIVNVLEQHSAPLLGVPSNTLNRKGEFTKSFKDTKRGQIFELGGGIDSPQSAKPEYITWDGKLDYAFKELDFMVRQLMASAGIPLSYIGLTEKDNNAQESGSAIKRRMARAIAKRNAKERQLDKTIKRLLSVGLKLMGVKNLDSDIEIIWGDGMPEDKKEEAEIRVLNVNAGVQSVEDGVRERMAGKPEEEIEEEIKRVKAGQPQGLGGAEANFPVVKLEE